MGREDGVKLAAWPWILDHVETESETKPGVGNQHPTFFIISAARMVRRLLRRSGCDP